VVISMQSQPLCKVHQLHLSSHALKHSAPPVLGQGDFLSQNGLCVSGLVIGAHNDKMLPLTRYACIASIPIIQLLTEHQIRQVVNKTRTAGHFVVNRLKTKGSFVAASVVIADIIKAILQDLNLLFSLSVYCQGQYGIEDCCVSLPVVVGYGGVKRILEINLNDKEKKI